MSQGKTRDENEMAFEVVSRTIKASSVSDAARVLSKLGASKGGKARAKRLSRQRRQEIARNAAEARWRKDNS